MLRHNVKLWLAALAVVVAVPLPAAEIWRLDNLQRIAGHAMSVVGAPRLAFSGQGVVFDGARDGLFVTGIPIAGAHAFTIEVLFRPASGGPTAQRFFHLEDKQTWRALMEIRTNGTEWWLDTFMWTGVKRGDPGLTLIDPKRVHPTDAWYWVALRYDGKTMSDFVNGVRELEGEKAFGPYDDGKISIGVRQNLMYWFKGAIREIRFHREALPPDQLQREPAASARP